MGFKIPIKNYIFNKNINNISIIKLIKKKKKTKNRKKKKKFKYSFIHIKNIYIFNGNIQYFALFISYNNICNNRILRRKKSDS